MKNKTKSYLDQLFERYPHLAPSREGVFQAFSILLACYMTGGKLLVCGNGGSAADSEHIVGELMKGFVLPRHIDKNLAEKLVQIYGEDGNYISKNIQRGLPTISLVSHTALSTAFANDQAPELTFAQQVLGYGKKGDVLLGISTSGNSKNVVYATEMANMLGLETIALTGSKDSKLSGIAKITIRASETETFKVQEQHLPIYHALCLAIENEIFGD